jgi:hypothetical protein
MVYGVEFQAALWGNKVRGHPNIKSLQFDSFLRKVLRKIDSGQQTNHLIVNERV